MTPEDVLRLLRLQNEVRMASIRELAAHAREETENRQKVIEQMRRTR